MNHLFAADRIACGNVHDLGAYRVYCFVRDRAGIRDLSGVEGGESGSN